MDTHPTPASHFELKYLASIRFIFQSPNLGHNLLIGSVFILIPMIGQIALGGWLCEIVQRLCKRHPQPIPKLDFSDFVHYLGRGAIAFLINFLVSFVMIIAFYILIFIIIASAGLLNSYDQAQTSSPFFALIIAGGLLTSFLAFLPCYALLQSSITYAELTEDFGQSLQPKKIFGYMKKTWKYFSLGLLVYLPIFYGLLIGGMLLCFVGMYPVVVWVTVTSAHFRWQVYEAYLSEGGEAIPLQNKSGPLPSEQRLASVVS